MDKYTRARFYVLDTHETTAADVDDALNDLASRPYESRVINVEGCEYRLESYEALKVDATTTVSIGHVSRVIDASFPGEYDRKRPLKKLEATNLANTSLFIVDVANSAVCVECTAARLTAKRLTKLIISQLPGGMVSLDDMLSPKGIEALANGYAKKVTFKIAKPQNLSKVKLSGGHSIASGIGTLVEAFKGDTIEATVAVGRGPRGLAQAPIRWMAKLCSESNRKELGLSKFSIDISELPDGTHPEPINLLVDTLEFGETLPLTKNDLEKNYDIKRAFMRRAYQTHLPTVKAHRPIAA